MKFKLISFVVLLVSAHILGCKQFIESEPLIVTVLMVKNEASVLEATLKPFVEGGVKHFVIFDTGSTDGTQEVATRFFKHHNITHAHIIQEPFIDFSTSRNHALDAARSFFPQATFMIMPDAEWYMQNVEGLLQFCSDHKDDCHTSYLVPIHRDTLAYYVARLIRCDNKSIKFVGPVHEALNQITYVKLPDTIYFSWRPSAKGKEKSAQRWLKDRDVLLQSYTENPHDPRTLFYLAQTYECLQDWENAYTYYEKRAEIKGWDEEDFVTACRLGRVAQMLAQRSPKTQVPLTVSHYLTAFCLRPHRAEPLIKIAQYYLDIGNKHLAFLFASRAAKIPYPINDILFVEKYLYDFIRYDILGICAWYVGEYDLGQWAVLQALKVQPHADYLLRNLKFYTAPKVHTVPNSCHTTQIDSLAQCTSIEPVNFCNS